MEEVGSQNGMTMYNETEHEANQMSAVAYEKPCDITTGVN